MTSSFDASLNCSAMSLNFANSIRAPIKINNKFYNNLIYNLMVFLFSYFLLSCCGHSGVYTVGEKNVNECHYLITKSRYTPVLLLLAKIEFLYVHNYSNHSICYWSRTGLMTVEYRGSQHHLQMIQDTSALY